MPPATDGGYRKFEVKTMIVDDNYDVDHTFKMNPFSLTAGSFTKVEILPKSYHAQKKTVYTFRLNPKNEMPQHGIFSIVYPKQVRIEDTSLSQSLCSNWKGFPSTTAVCTIFASNRTLLVTKGF